MHTLKHRKISNKGPNATSQIPSKPEQAKLKTSRREEFSNM
jgi:hypothetical protein